MMTFVTSGPCIGRPGLGGVGNSQGLMEDGLRDHHISTELGVAGRAFFCTSWRH